MKISNEVRVGVIGITTILVLIWGINYLKGRNILNSTYSLITFLPDSGGLEKSSPVTINGMKVGFVEDIQVRINESPAIKVVMDIESQYKIGKGSRAELISADLLGTKVIRIIPSEQSLYLKDRDIIPGKVEPDMISGLQSALLPILEKVDVLVSSLDSLSGQMNHILSEDALTQIIANLSDLTSSLKSSMSTGGSLYESFSNLENISGTLEGEKEEMASLIRNLNSVSESLKSSGLDSLTAEMTAVFAQLNTLTEQINSGEGSAGKLIYSDSLYQSVHILVADLDSLVTDLKENPKDYVQVSVFGKSKK